ncbi:MAG: hypothetical protein WKG01_04740 [Kofleriaceae bacterium]
MRLLVSVGVVMACGPPPAPVIVRGTPPPIVPRVTTPLACRSAVRNAPPVVGDAQGNPLELVPVESWHTYAAGWAGEELLLVRRVSELGYGDRSQSALERWSPADPTAPRARTLLPGDARIPRSRPTVRTRCSG